MNKSQLIDAVAKKAGLTRGKSSEVIAALIQSITDSLTKGESVTLIGFGSFSTSHRAARIGRNPKTGKEIKIAATTVPKFKAGKGLKEAVANPPKKRK